MKNHYPLVLQDKFLSINSKSGVYSAIERMKKEEQIEIIRIKKVPPEIFICLTKKGLYEMSAFSELIIKNQNQSQTQIGKTHPGKINVQKEMKELDDYEIAELAQDIVYKIVNGIGKKYEELTQEEDEKIEKITENIVRYIKDYYNQDYR